MTRDSSPTDVTAAILEEASSWLIELCDGERDLKTIVVELAQRYAAPPDAIEKDVAAMLADLKAKRVLET